MRFRVKSAFLNNAAIYFTFNLLNKSIPFLLLPLLTRYIAPEGYGKIAMFLLLINILMPIIGFSSNSILFQKYFSLDSGELSGFVRNVYQVIFTGFIFSIIAYGFGYNFIESVTGLDPVYIMLAIFCAVYGIVYTILLSLYQLKENPISYGKVQLSNTLLNLSLTLLFVIYYEQAWEGRIYSISISYFIFFIVSVILIQSLVGRYKRPVNANGNYFFIFKYGMYLLPSTISGAIILASDRIFLNNMIGMDVVGIYSVAITFALIFDIILNSIAQGYIPKVYELASNFTLKNNYKISIMILKVWSLIGALFLMAIVVVPLAMDVMIDQRYHEAIKFFPWILLSMGMLGFSASFHGLLLSKNKNLTISFISIFSILINLIFNYIFIPKYGAIGAAYATAISSAVLSFFIIIIGYSHYNLIMHKIIIRFF